MNEHEKTILTLISLAIQQLFRENNSPWTEDQSKEVADQIADVAWNGLILGMREMLAANRDVAFEEIGCFSRSETGWSFDPADSLLEAGALCIDPLEAKKAFATHCVFYLSQATSLINKLSTNIFIESSEHAYSIEEIGKQLVELFSAVENLRLFLLKRSKSTQSISKLLELIQKGIDEKWRRPEPYVRRKAQSPDVKEYLNSLSSLDEDVTQEILKRFRKYTERAEGEEEL